MKVVDQGLKSPRLKVNIMRIFSLVRNPNRYNFQYLVAFKLTFEKVEHI